MERLEKRRGPIEFTVGCDAMKCDVVGPQAPWLLMIETDYVWHKPLQAPRAEDPNAKPWGFPFGYIVPTSWSLDTVIRKMYPADKGPTSNIPNSGPAPILMRVAEWVKVGTPYPTPPKLASMAVPTIL